jgi:hypothetical protein
MLQFVVKPVDELKRQRPIVSKHYFQKGRICTPFLKILVDNNLALEFGD